MASSSGQHGNGIAKAGWMHRQSSVLHRWKKNWFVLDLQGDLRYFETPDSPRAEERIVVRAAVSSIKSAPDCRRADPPDGVSGAKASFLELVMRDKEGLLLCAETYDDMRAWQIALEDARTMHIRQGQAPVIPGVPGVVNTTHMIGPPGCVYYNSPFSSYGGYAGQVISPGPIGTTAQVLQTAPGVTTVVQQPAQHVVYVDDGPYRYRRRHMLGYPTSPFYW